LQLTANLNLILEIESSAMLQVILGMPAHPPRIFFCKPRFLGKFQSEAVFDRKIQETVFSAFFECELVLLVWKIVNLIEDALVEFIGVELI